VILGCTEIGLLVDDSVSSIPTYDTTDLHARALVAAALA
jgi:aspartate racemase